jgi:hypothetical protein
MQSYNGTFSDLVVVVVVKKKKRLIARVGKAERRGIEEAIVKAID